MLLNCKKENICPDHFPNFNLGSFIIIKSMFIMKNLTDFRKTVETGVNPHLDTRIQCFLGGFQDYGEVTSRGLWTTLGASTFVGKCKFSI